MRRRMRLRDRTDIHAVSSFVRARMSALLAWLNGKVPFERPYSTDIFSSHLISFRRSSFAFLVTLIQRGLDLELTIRPLRADLYASDLHSLPRYRTFRVFWAAPIIKFLQERFTFSIQVQAHLTAITGWTMGMKILVFVSSNFAMTVVVKMVIFRCPRVTWHFPTLIRFPAV